MTDTTFEGVQSGDQPATQGTSGRGQEGRAPGTGPCHRDLRERSDSRRGAYQQGQRYYLRPPRRWKNACFALSRREKADRGDVVIYIDMSTDLGSTGSLYSDGDYPVAERATRLLVDAISIIHRQLLDSALAEGPGPDISMLDQVLEHLSEVIVSQAAEAEMSTVDEFGSSASNGVSIKAGKSPELNVNGTTGTNRKFVSSGRRKASGPIRTRVHFGAIASLFGRIIRAVPAGRVWLIIDEWNSVPVVLQPYLGEMLRRLFFNIPKVTVRIAAIPQRTEWRTSPTPGSYVGVEVGAEIFPILDLDEFALFLDNIDGLEDERRAFHFYGSLLLKHLNGVLAGENQSVGSVEELTQVLFAGHDVVAQAGLGGERCATRCHSNRCEGSPAKPRQKNHRSGHPRSCQKTLSDR